MRHNPSAKMPAGLACLSHTSTFSVTVSILFITPTTVYFVAETSDWHQKPAQEMPMPMTHERPSHKSDAFVICRSSGRSGLSSPAKEQQIVAGVRVGDEGWG